MIYLTHTFLIEIIGIVQQMSLSSAKSYTFPHAIAVEISKNTEKLDF